jgi:hypothetical protein
LSSRIRSSNRIVLCASSLVALLSFWNRNDLPPGSAILPALAEEPLQEPTTNWGDTAVSPHLSEIEFWNGVFTCNFETSDDAAWQSIRPEQIANNHLISDDDAIRDRVADVRVGDQVRVRGWLATYGSGRNKRGTSTTRDDTGNGACETIFVADFDVVGPAPGHWRAALYASLAVLALALFMHFRLPYRPYA